MGLSEDQKAMLRLLAQREEGYEDIAALRGLSVGEVRAKVKEALAGLDQSGGLAEDQKAMLRLLAQREEGYEDIASLLGLGVGEVRVKVKEALVGMDGPATAAAAPKPVVAAPPPAEPEATSAPEPAPAKPVPPSTPEPVSPGRPASKPAAASTPRRGISLPRERRRLVEIGGAALVVLLLVLFATGAVDLGGGDSDSDDSDAPTATADQANSKVTQAVLAPPDGGDAIGQAVFGKVGKDPVLLVQAKGLDPSPAGKSYTIWLYRSPKLALRVGAVKVDEKGGIGAQFPVPLELLSYISAGAFNQIYISLTDDDSYRSEIALAKKQKRLPAYSGTTVLSGGITGPLVEREAAG